MNVSLFLSGNVILGTIINICFSKRVITPAEEQNCLRLMVNQSQNIMCATHINSIKIKCYSVAKAFESEVLRMRKTEFENFIWKPEHSILYAASVFYLLNPNNEVLIHAKDV